MVNIGKPSISKEEIFSKITEIDLVNYYFKVDYLPILIHSPLRKDKNPSFAFFTKDNKTVGWIDFSTKEKGTLLTLLGKYWCKTYDEVLIQISKDLPYITNVTYNSKHSKRKKVKVSSDSQLLCQTREWKSYDIEYWESYGISLKWLKYANVYPVEYKIIIKDDVAHLFKADKYAYAYVEFKEGRCTMKIYQPFNTQGFKWSNKHDKSVISLWTKVPKEGDRICICSSLKDSLCLWANTGIPCINVQGEGYSMSKTAINELKRRFKQIYILFDNDEAGLKDGISLAESTGFTNLVLPQFSGGKDVSDLMKSKGKEEFLKIILPLFNNKEVNDYSDVPF